MGEGSLLLCALHEHRDRRPNTMIDVYHENLVLVAKENRAAAARRGHSADLHFDNGFAHTANLVTRLPAKIRIAFNGRSGTRTIKVCSPAPSKMRSVRVSGHRSKGMRVRPPNLHPRMSDPRLAQSVVGNPG